MDYCYEKEESAPGSASIGVVVTAAATPANPAIQIAAARRARLNSLLGRDELRIVVGPVSFIGPGSVGYEAQQEPVSLVSQGIRHACTDRWRWVLRRALGLSLDERRDDVLRGVARRAASCR